MSLGFFFLINGSKLVLSVVCSFFFFSFSTSEDRAAVLLPLFICVPADVVMNVRVFEKHVRDITSVQFFRGKAILQGVLRKSELKRFFWWGGGAEDRGGR